VENLSVFEISEMGEKKAQKKARWMPRFTSIRVAASAPGAHSRNLMAYEYSAVLVRGVITWVAFLALVDL
jgi:hypothetical protein